MDRAIDTPSWVRLSLSNILGTALQPHFLFFSAFFIAVAVACLAGAVILFAPVSWQSLDFWRTHGCFGHLLGVVILYPWSCAGIALIVSLPIWMAFSCTLGALTRSVLVRRDDDASVTPAGPFLRRRLSALFWGYPIMAIGFLFFLVVGLAIDGALGLCNGAFAGLGTLLAALVTLVALFCAFIEALILAGLLSIPLIPAAVAVEGIDAFDALARGMSYQYAGFLRYVVLQLFHLLVAVIPAAAVLLLSLNGNLEGDTRWVFGAISGVIAVSYLMAAQLPTYLYLRKKVDATRRAVFARTIEPHPTREKKPPEETSEKAPAGAHDAEEKTGDEEGGGVRHPVFLRGRIADFRRLFILALDLRKMILTFTWLALSIGALLAVFGLFLRGNGERVGETVSLPEVPALAFRMLAASPSVDHLLILFLPLVIAGVVGAFFLTAAARIFAVEVGAGGSRIEIRLALAFGKRAFVSALLPALLIAGGTFATVVVLSGCFVDGGPPSPVAHVVLAAVAIALLWLGSIWLCGIVVDRLPAGAAFGRVLAHFAGNPVLYLAGQAVGFALVPFCAAGVLVVAGMMVFWTVVPMDVGLGDAADPIMGLLQGTSSFAAMGFLDKIAAVVFLATLFVVAGLAVAYVLVAFMTAQGIVYVLLRRRTDNVSPRTFSFLDEEVIYVEDERKKEHKKGIVDHLKRERS